MPRVKDAQDWSLTWSPENDVSEFPEFWKDVCESPHITRYYAILERHDEESKWHMHVGFTTKRSYNSDYKWWQKASKESGFEEPALEIHYHNDIIGLVGGYCSKALKTDRKIIGSKGFTEEQLQYGQEIYERGLRKQRIRKHADRHHIITPDKLELVIGAQMAELDCDKEEAIVELAADGWAFARSVKGLEEVYKHLYADRQRHESTVSNGT